MLVDTTHEPTSGGTDTLGRTDREARPPGVAATARKKAWRNLPDRVEMMRADPALSSRWLSSYLTSASRNLSGSESPEQIAVELDLAGCPRWMRDDAVRAVLRMRDARSGAPVLQRQSSLVGVTTTTPVGYQCRYCEAPAQTIDHVWPRSRGGDDHPNNLVPACSQCNSTKGGQSWLTDRCPGCDGYRDPGDVETSTGRAYYACRCGTSWATTWDLQRIRWRKARPSNW